MKSIELTQPTTPARHITLPVVTGYQGTGLSVANRDWTVGRPTEAATSAHSLLPISDVDVAGVFGGTDDRAGIRTWSPPV